MQKLPIHFCLDLIAAMKTSKKILIFVLAVRAC